MPLTQEQYDRIMQHYQTVRNRHGEELRERRAEVYARIPEFRALDSEIPEMGAGMIRRLLSSRIVTDEDNDGAANGIPSLRPALSRVSRQKEELLVKAGFPADYLEPVYDCPLCHDTGYIRSEGEKKCSCFLRMESEYLSRSSNLESLLLTENFEHLSYRYHTGEDLVRYRKAVDAAYSFAKTFGSDYRNLFFYGVTGTGKSFLSSCIAQRLTASGKSVRYFSAASLFEQLAALAFSSGGRDAHRDFTEDLYHCDLLILDDLGTELTNNFVITSLFSIINERYLGQKPCIISSNLSPQELQRRYSDRIFSRIASSYELYRFSGDDIRIQKRREHR